jgi:hypothetical protein
MEKQITLMPDHGCSPLWMYDAHDLVDNPDPDELPVTADLKVALERWSAAYEGTTDVEDPLNSGFATPADEEAFEAEGRRLCAELQAQLGPEYTVSYCRRRETRSHDLEIAGSDWGPVAARASSPGRAR